MKNMYKKFGIFMLFLVIMSISVFADPIATTNAATNIDETTVTLNGALTNLTEDNSTVYFYYKTSAATTYTKSSVQVLTTNTSFSLDITGLDRYTDYVYFSAVTNANLSEEFNATTSKTFTTLSESEGNVIAGVGSVKTIIYTAIGLIALMILVTAAVLMTGIFSGSLDTDALMEVAIYGIGGAIILAVGIVIIGLVATAIIG